MRADLQNGTNSAKKEAYTLSMVGIVPFGKWKSGLEKAHQALALSAPDAGCGRAGGHQTANR